MNPNPLLSLADFGQSYWLDNLTRAKIDGGELERRVAEEGLHGITSNPAIFHKAITAGHDYDARIRRAFAAGSTAQMRFLAVGSEPRSGTAEQLLDRHGISRRAIVEEISELARQGRIVQASDSAA